MARMGWNPKPRRGATPSRGLVYLSPYNDPYVVAGQGTIGAELARQLDRIDVLCISVGGGGLVGGVAAGYLKDWAAPVWWWAARPRSPR